jgi:hypothetical protein
MSRLEQLKAFVAWEKSRNPDLTHIAEWALNELTADKCTSRVWVNKDDAEQILEDPKADVWELRGLASDLLADNLELQRLLNHE